MGLVAPDRKFAFPNPHKHDLGVVLNRHGGGGAGPGRGFLGLSFGTEAGVQRAISPVAQEGEVSRLPRAGDKGAAMPVSGDGQRSNPQTIGITSEDYPTQAEGAIELVGPTPGHRRDRDAHREQHTHTTAIRQIALFRRLADIADAVFVFVFLKRIRFIRAIIHFISYAIFIAVEFWFARITNAVEVGVFLFGDAVRFGCLVVGTADDLFAACPVTHLRPGQSRFFLGRDDV